jgi:hypothetical protein
VYVCDVLGVPLNVMAVEVAELENVGFVRVPNVPPVCVIVHTGAVRNEVGKVTVTTGLAPGVPAGMMVNASLTVAPETALTTAPVPQPEVKATFVEVCVVPVMEQSP